MPREQLNVFGISNQIPLLLRSWLILKDAHAAAKAFLDLFDGSIQGRQGTPTNKQQDLLRAMLVFAAAGLDSMLKQLVRNYLPVATRHSESARRELNKYVKRRLGGGGGLSGADMGIRSPQVDVLVRLLLAGSPADAAVADLGDELLAESLQSLEQIHRALRCMGLSVPALTSREKADTLRAAISARNMIVHEMDINFESTNRKRKSRRRDDMVRLSNAFLQIADSILRAAIANARKQMT